MGLGYAEVPWCYKSTKSHCHVLVATSSSYHAKLLHNELKTARFSACSPEKSFIVLMQISGFRFGFGLVLEF